MRRIAHWLRNLIVFAVAAAAAVLFTPLGDGQSLPAWRDLSGAWGDGADHLPVVTLAEPDGEVATGQQAPASQANALLNDLTMTPGQARATLDTLDVVAPGTMAGYSRDRFPHWESATAHGWPGQYKGCDARRATLLRDTVATATVDGQCDVQGGQWVDPYTGAEISDPSKVDIDHVVPLAAAYRAGASKWSTDQATTFANAPLNLVAAGASANREKGDKGPEAWAPAESARCVYATRWIAVKYTYALDLTATAERDTLAVWLDTCPATTDSDIDTQAGAH